MYMHYVTTCVAISIEVIHVHVHLLALFPTFKILNPHMTNTVHQMLQRPMQHTLTKAVIK